MLDTAFRVSELVSLDLEQYQGKHFTNVKRKGNHVTDRVFVGQAAREALDRYVRRGPRATLPGRSFNRNAAGGLLRRTSPMPSDESSPRPTPGFRRPSKSTSRRTFFATRRFGRWPRRRASATPSRWPATPRPSTSGATSSPHGARWKTRSRSCSTNPLRALRAASTSSVTKPAPHYERHKETTRKMHG